MKVNLNQDSSLAKQNKTSVFVGLGENTDGITTADKNRIAEIAQSISQLPEEEQEKIYYMLKGLEVFNGRPGNIARGA